MAKDGLRSGANSEEQAATTCFRKVVGLWVYSAEGVGEGKTSYLGRQCVVVGYGKNGNRGGDLWYTSKRPFLFGRLSGHGLILDNHVADYLCIQGLNCVRVEGSDGCWY